MNWQSPTKLVSSALNCAIKVKVPHSALIYDSKMSIRMYSTCLSVNFQYIKVNFTLGGIQSLLTLIGWAGIPCARLLRKLNTK